MASDAEEPRTESTEEQGEGGPVKTFLEHLEDLRWVLIKSFSFLGIAVLLCLIGGPVVMKVLLWPKERAKTSTSAYVTELTDPLVARLHNTALARWRITQWLFKQHGTADENQHVSIYLGTNQVYNFTLSKEERDKSPYGTNRLVALQLDPVPFGTNEGVMTLALRPSTNAALVKTAEKLNIKIIILGPADSFIVSFRIAIYAGIVLAAPFIVYFVAAFVFPALRFKEKKYIYRGMIWGLGLFMVGVSFCYFGLMPVALTASVQYSNWLGLSAMEWRAEDYASFVSKFLLGMGVGFELPVVIVILAKLGIVNYKFLAKARPYVIVINFILGAVLTTPEVITQVLMAVPLQMLYELTVWLVWWQERKEKKRKALEEQQEQAQAGG
jgi:sec-independent protein translocase protein TatC